MKELIVTAETENLHNVFAFISGELAERAWTAKDIRQVKLCVEEIYMNIVHYAYRPDVGPVRITVEIPADSRVVISFTDHGRPFNPLEAPPPDIDSGIDERKAGGLGIYLVRTKMDNVTYDYKDGQNILTITKAVA